MKPATEMTEAEKEQIRAWIRNWEKAGPILEDLRWESIRRANTVRAIAAFDGAFQTAVRDVPCQPWSGLIEQQRLFQLARR